MTRKPAKSRLPKLPPSTHNGQVGLCPECGHRVVLPCLACRIEATWDKVDEPKSLSIVDGLAIALMRKGERKRYQVLKQHRDKHQVPMLPDPEE